MANLDTKTNIEQNWSIDDWADAHEVLDIKHEQEAFHLSQRN